MVIIQSGRVTINGRVEKEPSRDVNGSEEITVDGKKVSIQKYTYIMLHKPSGYTTTKDDPHADKKILDLLPKDLHYLSPVGRLDRDSEGLLLLTNDGPWAYGLTHPKFHLDKTYQARIIGQLKPEEQKRLEAGIVLEGRKTSACRITDVRYNDGHTDLTITIHEGRKRQVRTMFYTVGHKVTY